MRRGIFGTEICFNFDDTSRQQLAPFSSDEDFAQQIWPYQTRIAVVEVARKNPKRGWPHLFRRWTHDLIIAANSIARKCSLAQSPMNQPLRAIMNREITKFEL
jgi:hypothetical protein